MNVHPEIVPSFVDRIKQTLVALKMPRAIEILDVILRRLEHGEMTAIEAIDALLAEELTLRENRRIKIALMMARLSSIKTLAGFDFSFQPSLDKNRIMALAELEFIERREVVHFLGPPGTGKSHLSLALGVQAVRAGRSVYFTPLSDLVSTLAKAEREGTLREKIRFFCRFALLIVDEIGYLPVVAGGGNLFFQLVNARYEKGAMILTSNRGFAEWGEVFGDPVVATALLDRLLHHAIVIQIEGSSYRLRQHADLVPTRKLCRGSAARPGGCVVGRSDGRLFQKLLCRLPESVPRSGPGAGRLRRARSVYPQQSLADTFKGSADANQRPDPGGAGYPQQSPIRSPSANPPQQNAYVPHPPSTYVPSGQPYTPPQGQPAYAQSADQQNYAAPPAQPNASRTAQQSSAAGHFQAPAPPAPVR